VTDQLPPFVTVDDFEPIARQRLPSDVYDFYAGGAGDERTLAENRAAFDRITLRPRFLRAAGNPDPSSSVLGTPLSFPVLVAPWAYQRLAHPDGEVATARAAAEAGTIMVVSTTAYDRLEEIAGATSGPKWWQLYVFQDRGFTGEMLTRVADAGFGAICWTVDFPVGGLRHRDTRSGFLVPMGVATTDLPFDPGLSWDDVAWIRERAPGLPLLIKGIMTAEDARLAVEAGVDGIVVSNHGGRQLDGVAAGITALPEVAEATEGRVPVLMDGGVRRGTDVVKAIALGATAVLVGRAVVWGLAAGGERGVVDVLRILRDELVNAMALTGCRSVAEIGRGLVTSPPA
jgi:isopentenyl diphosphate isomerase/L-lactate dehydrogenase-like FMN-dependent dehydrogenase